MSEIWITLRTFDSAPQAELARVALANAGIPCQLHNAEVVSMDWLLGNAVGYIPLQVPPGQLDAAKQVLGGGFSADVSETGHCANCSEPLTSDGQCPMCGGPMCLMAVADRRPMVLPGLMLLGDFFTRPQLPALALLMVVNAGSHRYWHRST